MLRSNDQILGLLERVFAVAALLLMTDAVVLLATRAGDPAAGDAAADGNALFQYLAAGVYAVTGLLILLRLNAFLTLCRQHPLLLALLAVAVGSTAWSVMPEVTLRRGVALTGTTVFAMWLAMRFQPEQLMRLVGATLAIAMGLSIAAVVLLPEYGVHHTYHQGDWRGVFVHKNVMARVALLALITFVLLSLPSARSGPMRPVYVMLALSSMGLVVMSGSRTAWIVWLGLMAAAVVVAVLRLQRSLLAPVAWAAPAVIIVVVGGAIIYGGDLLGMVDRDVTLTGRTVAWELGAASARERPWLGWGYGAFWHSDEGAAGFIRHQLGWNAYTTGHNGFLDLWLEVGLVGGVLWLALVGLGLIRLIRLIRLHRRHVHPLVLWHIMFISYLLLLNVASTMSLARNNIVWVWLVIMVCHVRMLWREAPSRETRPTKQPSLLTDQPPLPGGIERGHVHA